MNIGNLRDALDKEMDRREFLAYMGAVILGVVGVTGLIKTLENPHASRQERKTGYSSGPYGR